MTLQCSNDHATGYAIGDIHGHLRELEELLDYIRPDSGDRLIFLGDYIGKGPDSDGVMRKLLQLDEQGFDITLLVGNWEQFVVSAEGYSFHEYFVEPSLQLLSTDNLDLSQERFHSDEVSSALVDSEVQAPDHYKQVLSKLELLHCEQGYVFVHAGLSEKALSKPTLHLALSEQLSNDPSYIMTGRTRMKIQQSFPETLVHGHVSVRPPTAHLSGEVKEYELDNTEQLPGRVNVNLGIDQDGGALAAFRFPDNKIIVLGKHTS